MLDFFRKNKMDTPSPNCSIPETSITGSPSPDSALPVSPSPDSALPVSPSPDSALPVSPSAENAFQDSPTSLDKGQLAQAPAPAAPPENPASGIPPVGGSPFPPEGEPGPEEKKLGWFGRLRKKFSSQDEPDNSESQALESQAPPKAGLPAAEPEAPIDEPVATVAESAPDEPVATVAGPEPTVAGTPIAEPEAPIDEPVPTVAESAPVEPVATVAESAPVEPISPVAGQEASAGQSVESPEAEEAPEAKAGWFGRLRQKLYHGPEGPKDQGEQEPDEPQTQVGQTPSQAASKAELAPVAEGDQAGPGSQIEFAAEAAETRPQVEGDQQAPETEAAPEAKASWLGRLKQKLSSTREMLAGRLERALSAVRSIDDDVLDELEEIMITSDLGVKTTNDILNKIRGQVAKKELKDAVALKEAIRARIEEMVSLPLPTPKVGTPYVQLVIGVNGVGKTTTIAKLGHMHQNNGKKVLLAAGDTFRAAAVEQLTIWANRIKADIVSQPTGADPSAVVFDSLTAAKARGIDNVIIDTAGRLHTKVNLMDELKKIKRVADKALPGAPHETILVLDANTGQNAANQAQIFNEAIGVDSLIVTKLDGTSKGGVIVSIINEHKIPVKYIGIGENFEDLRLFDAQAFVEAIMGPKG